MGKIKKSYDDDYAGARMEQITHAIAQAEKGEVITKTLAGLEAMESD